MTLQWRMSSSNLLSNRKNVTIIEENGRRKRGAEVIQLVMVDPPVVSEEELTLPMRTVSDWGGGR